MAFEIFTKKENPSEGESEMIKIYELVDRRELLQARWSELFEEEENLENKYPFEVRFDENKKYKGDRSFLTSDDMEQFKEAENGIHSIEEERNEIDKEILKIRFENGLRHLEELLKREDIQWRQIEDHNPNLKNSYDTLTVKKWLAKIGDDIAEVEFIGGKVTSFIKGVEKVAEEIDDQEVLQRLKKWPKERKIPYQDYYLRFLYGPKKRKRFDEYLRPGLTLSKRYDSYDEKYDITEAHLSLSHRAYAFPEISKEELERGKDAMIQLGEKLEIDNL